MIEQEAKMSLGLDDILQQQPLPWGCLTLDFLLREKSKTVSVEASGNWTW